MLTAMRFSWCCGQIRDPSPKQGLGPTRSTRFSFLTVSSARSTVKSTSDETRRVAVPDHVPFPARFLLHSPHGSSETSGLHLPGESGAAEGSRLAARLLSFGEER